MPRRAAMARDLLRRVHGTEAVAPVRAMVLLSKPSFTQSDISKLIETLGSYIPRAAENNFRFGREVQNSNTLLIVTFLSRIVLDCVKDTLPLTSLKEFLAFAVEHVYLDLDDINSQHMSGHAHQESLPYTCNEMFLGAVAVVVTGFYDCARVLDGKKGSIARDILDMVEDVWCRADSKFLALSQEATLRALEIMLDGTSDYGSLERLSDIVTKVYLGLKAEGMSEWSRLYACSDAVLTAAARLEYQLPPEQPTTQARAAVIRALLWQAAPATRQQHISVSQMGNFDTLARYMCSPAFDLVTLERMVGLHLLDKYLRSDNLSVEAETGRPTANLRDTEGMILFAEFCVARIRSGASHNDAAAILKTVDLLRGILRYGVISTRWAEISSIFACQTVADFIILHGLNWSGTNKGSVLYGVIHLAIEREFITRTFIDAGHGQWLVDMFAELLKVCRFFPMASLLLKHTADVPGLTYNSLWRDQAAFTKLIVSDSREPCGYWQQCMWTVLQILMQQSDFCHYFIGISYKEFDDTQDYPYYIFLAATLEQDGWDSSEVKLSLIISILLGAPELASGIFEGIRASHRKVGVPDFSASEQRAAYAYYYQLAVHSYIVSGVAQPGVPTDDYICPFLELDLRRQLARDDGIIVSPIVDEYLALALWTLSVDCEFLCRKHFDLFRAFCKLVLSRSVKLSSATAQEAARETLHLLDENIEKPWSSFSTTKTAAIEAARETVEGGKLEQN